MDTFQKQKQDFLSKKDKSKKGSIDEKMKPIIALINSLPSYYTTSSCAGRIVLLHQISGKKQESKWLFSSHSPIRASQLQKSLSTSKLPKKGVVWLLAEAPIMHIACRTVDDAWNLLGIFKRGGFKRASILSSTPNKTTIEAFGNHRVEVPVAEKGMLLFPLETVAPLTKNSNEKLRRSHLLLKRLKEVLAKNKKNFL